MSIKRKAAEAAGKLTNEEHRTNLIRGIFLDTESTELIERLFKLIDTNSDGTLTIQDFDTPFVSAVPKQLAKWNELRLHFDANCDGEISIAEFKEGFKKLALSRPAAMGSLPPADTSLSVWLDEIEGRVNLATKDLCEELFQMMSA
eukprot:m.84637 g.84637  ORF g.84637 m.84637 type:complete len:146 (-) comp50842_c0_seq1:117-554(-)